MNDEFRLNKLNSKYEFVEHGEVWLQERFSGKFSTIFDIGSNIGEWTKMVRTYQPTAKIHMFEIVPDTYQKMLRNITLDSNMIPNGFGLLDVSGTVPVTYVKSYDALSTTIPNINFDETEDRTGIVFTGDDYIESRQINNIDYLKIDAEGSEDKIFKGFSKTLKDGKIDIIQFEYGYVSILTKWLLYDSYKLLEPLGYKLGRMHKDHIEFHNYTLVDETFVGPEYIAVHEKRWSDFGL